MNIRTIFISASALALLTSCQSSTPKSTAPAKTYSYDITDDCYYTSKCYSVLVGSKQIDTSKLSPANARWSQRTLKDGKWVTSPGTFDEKLTQLQGGHWQHVQTILVGGKARKTETRVFDKDTLQVLNLTMEFANPPEGAPKQVFYDLTQDDFSADITMPDGTQAKGKTRTKALPMFDGQVAGLTLAALPLSEGYSATMPMIIPNLGIYWIEAKVIDRRMLAIENGESIEVWEVTANWLNLGDGDIYEPGPDADGGSYYMAVTPGDGVPAVIEYANSGARITWDGIRR